MRRILAGALPLILVASALLACKKEEKKPEVQINASGDKSGVSVETKGGKVQIGTSGSGGSTAGIQTGSASDDSAYVADGTSGSDSSASTSERVFRSVVRLN